MPKKVILTCAITGGVHTPTMSDALPYTADDLATQAIAAADAGASILHVHARNPENGMPSPHLKDYMGFLPRVKQSTNAVINITTGGSPSMTVQDRISAPLELKPEMCSLNMGSINFALFPMADYYDNWKYDWEQAYVRQSDDFIFRNTFRDIEYILTTLGHQHHVKFEHECYDVGHLYNLAYFVKKGLIKPPFFLQFVFGIMGGIGSDIDNLVFMKRTADRLFGNRYQWSVLAAGRHQMSFCTTAGIMGGNVRVGLEDSLYISKGTLADNNAQQVTKIKTILEELSLEIATPDEARDMLDLKGGDQVAF